VTFSAGIAVCSGPPCTLETLLSLADNALYSAKAHGRNRSVMAPIAADGA
jgi:PleD family two-component response regulator